MQQIAWEVTCSKWPCFYWPQDWIVYNLPVVLTAWLNLVGHFLQKEAGHIHDIQQVPMYMLGITCTCIVTVCTLITSVTMQMYLAYQWAFDRITYMFPVLRATTLRHAGLSWQGPLCWVHVGVSCISAWVHTHLHNLAYARKWPVITDLEAHLHNLLFFSHISCIYARSRIYGRFSLMQICYECKILYMRENFPIITDFEAHLNNSRYFLYISCIYTRSRIYGRFSDLLYIQDLAYMQDLAYIADFH